VQFFDDRFGENVTVVVNRARQEINAQAAVSSAELRPSLPVSPTAMARLFTVGSVVALLVTSGCAYRRDSAVRAAFERELASRPSATESLRQWCETRGIARPAEIRAKGISGFRAPPAELFNRLNVPADTALGYRNVELSCGGTVLSVAQLWYVPSLLTPAMRTTLNETETPFGRAVSALNFSRERISQSANHDPACPAGTILVHKAALRLASGEGLAIVIECYTKANLMGQAGR
jgi:hypothetical protein